MKSQQNRIELVARPGRNQGKSESWAKEHFVHHKELERASDIRNQLVALMTFHGVPVVSAGT